MSGRALQIQSSPHLTSGVSVDLIMRNVVWALLPVTAFAGYAFGLTGLVTLGTALLTCLATEHVLCRVSRRPTTLGDWSAAITGLLYGLTLPPGLPAWMVVVGGVIAIGLGKHLFGGLGSNAFNPALVGRAVLQATFPVAMTTWVDPFLPGRFLRILPSALTWPFTQPALNVDAVSQATPLAAWKFEHQLAEASDLLFGVTSGSAGETSAVLILAGGAWLVARKMMSWRTPLAILGTVALLAWALRAAGVEACPPPLFMLFSGGLMLGAVFMATDMVGSPMTHRGCVLYGALIGILVVVIRVWGGMPEGVMYAILLGNAITPHVDRLIQPRVYGTGRPGRARRPAEARP